MSDLTNQAPYYDDYDSSKQFTQIVAVPGRIEQAREFTQVQTMIFDFLKRLSDTLLKDGNIVSGMGFTFNGNDITVETGKVYLGGKIHVFDSQTLTMTKTGYEKIGVKLQENMITENEDSSLRDPALNMGNYGQPGAYRVKSVPVLTLNDDNAATIFEFEDGLLKVEVSKPAMDGLTDILARRTYDESGNYLVRGMDLHVAPYDADNVQVTVEAGTCYVKGYEIIKPTPVKKLLPISKDVKAALSEPKIYQTGTDKYALNNFPAKDITRVVGQVQKSTTMTRGNVVNGIDYLPDTSVISIQAVTAGATTYLNGTDYQLTADGVDWGLGGSEPAIGSTYNVAYTYNKEMVQGTDYQQYQEVGQWGETTDYIQFLSGGSTPVAGTQFNVDYEFFLSRYDMISMNKTGDVIVTSGQADVDRLAKIPVVQDPELLNLGSIYCPANSGNAKATSAAITRMDMATIQKMLQRLEDVEFNQAVTALDQEAMSGESPSNLIGVFSDGFATTDKGDLTHPDFTAMYSLEDSIIMLPPKDITDHNPVVDTNNSEAKIWGRLISAPMTEVRKITQPYATTTMKINPYLAFNSLGVLKLTPAVDNWIETARIEIQNTAFKARNFHRWWRHAGSNIQKDLIDLKMDNGQSVSEWRGAIGEQTVVTQTTKSSTIIKEAITYMRQITVTIDAQNLEPNTDNLKCTFDGVSVALTPVTGYSAGSQSGSVRSDSKGRVKATFLIPSGIRTGTREVVLSNASNTAATAFTSIGTKETTVDKILTTRITLTAVDPLAQTFQFDTDTILTTIGVFFASKDATNNVQVQVRNTIAGYPGNVIYGEKILTPTDVVASANASVETKITFDDPIMCKSGEQYCVVVISDSATDSMYVADLGQKDITSGQLITRQPYLAGMLFSSSNAVAWTAHQSMNMKFNVYVAQFQPTGTVAFDPILNMPSDKLLLLSDYLTPANTGCIWQASLNDGAFQPVSNYEDFDTGVVIDKVVLQAVFKADTNMSPLMAKDSFTLVGFLQDTDGSYVSKNTTLIDPYTHVKIVYDGFIPQGATITPKFSYDNGTTWITPTQTGTYEVELGWTRFTNEYDVPLATNALNFRVRLDIHATSSVIRPKARKLMCIMK